MNYAQDHIPLGKLRSGTKIVATSITIHSTGNPTSTAKNERGWLTNPINDRIASWHIVIDEKEAIEVIPLDEVAYHAGDKQGNNFSIGIEICESGNREKTLSNAARLVAEMLYERGWGIDSLKRHYDWSGKICPRIMSQNNWQGWIEFKNKVSKELENMEQTEQTPSPWAKDAWEWAIKEGITDGTDPRGIATREQLVTMIYRALKKQNNE